MNRGPLGIVADFLDGNPRELHRGEFVRQMSSSGITSVFKYELKRIGVAALFDTEESCALNDLAVLRRRKLSVAEAVEQRIENERDLAKRDDWLVMVATAASVAELERALEVDSSERVFLRREELSS